MNTTAKVLTGIVGGLAAGAILGILFAPDKGSQTRQKINDQGKNLADGVKNKFQRSKNRLNELKSDVANAVNGNVEEFS